MNLISRNVLSVFLASPGNLVNERSISREVVDRINRILGKEIGLHVELFGWEDTLPGAGRPQSIINQEVDICDVFIGLLWKRWGTLTGEFSSGFEEEFSIAQKRYEATGKPEIWLFFKDVDEDSLQDPGEQLKLALAFREQQIKDKKYLFKTFSNPEEWRENFDEILMRYLMKLSRLSKVSEPTPDESLVPSSELMDLGSIRSPEIKRKNKVAHQKIIEVLEKTLETVREGAFGRVSAESTNLGEFDVSRLFLAGAALLSHRYTYEPLGVHEINLLYKHREQLDLVPVELLLILRTIISTTHENVPGWYWFSNFKKTGLSALLRYIATHDSDEAVRERAVKFITSTGLLPGSTQSDYEKFYRQLLSDRSQKVRIAALGLLGHMGSLNDLQIVEAIMADKKSDTYGAALKSKLEIVLRNQPELAFSVVLDSSFANAFEKHSFLEKAVVKAKDEALVANLMNPDKNIGEAIIKELDSRNMLTLENAYELLKDPAISVRQIACLAIIRARGEISLERIRQFLKEQETPANVGGALGRVLSGVDTDLVILELFLSWPLSNLMEKVNWYSLEGPLAYQAIAINYFNEESIQIETDLMNGFMEMRQKAIGEIEAGFKQTAEKAIVDFEKRAKAGDRDVPTDLFMQQTWHKARKTIAQFQEVDEFIMRNFTRAALVGIALNGDANSIRFGRQYLNNQDEAIKLEALKIIERCGDNSDLRALVDLAKSSHGELKTKSATLALKLASDYKEAIMPFLATEDTELVIQAVEHIWNDDLRKARRILEPLLNSKKDDIRKVALSYFIHKMRRQQLEEMLNQSLGRRIYYYNIVHWLDTALYVPRIIRSQLLRRLTKD